MTIDSEAAAAAWLLACILTYLLSLLLEEPRE